MKILRSDYSPGLHSIDGTVEAAYCYIKYMLNDIENNDIPLISIDEEEHCCHQNLTSLLKFDQLEEET